MSATGERPQRCCCDRESAAAAMGLLMQARPNDGHLDGTPVAR